MALHGKPHATKSFPFIQKNPSTLRSLAQSVFTKNIRLQHRTAFETTNSFSNTPDGLFCKIEVFLKFLRIVIDDYRLKLSNNGNFAHPRYMAIT